MAEKNKRGFGSSGENIALEYLVKNGYEVIARNFRLGRFGEIDIIAKDREYLCFIEVKTRSSLKFGLPCEAVGIAKQQKIRKLASFYLDKNKLANMDVRFDVVEVLVGKGARDGGISINLIKNAF